MTTRASISIGFKLSEINSVSRFGGLSNWEGSIDLLKSFAHGTGVDQCDLGYLAERTVSDGANDDVDLSGVLTTALGSTIAMAELVAMFVLNRPRDPNSANTTDLTLGGATNPFVGFLSGTTPKIGPIKPGGFMLIGAGHASGIGAIAGGSTDIFRIANSAGAANTYVLGLLGRTV